MRHPEQIVFMNRLSEHDLSFHVRNIPDFRIRFRHLSLGVPDSEGCNFFDIPLKTVGIVKHGNHLVHNRIKPSVYYAFTFLRFALTEIMKAGYR